MADKAITAEQMRHYDSYTINTIGIPSLVLMERAALAVRDEVLTAFPLNLQNIVVVAGSGNNGGDGLDVARLLHIAGVKVTILNVGNPDHASNEHQVQDRICQYYKIPQTSDLNVLKDASLIVDALFGIGKDTLYRLIHKGTISHINLGTNQIRVSKEELLRLYPLRKKALTKPKPVAKLYSLEPKDCYTIGEISKKFHLEDSTVYLHIRKYSIPTRQIGNFVYVPKKEIDNLYKGMKR